MKTLSKKDAALLAQATDEANQLVATLGKMVGADGGLLGIFTQELQDSAVAIHGKLKLAQAVTRKPKKTKEEPVATLIALKKSCSIPEKMHAHSVLEEQGLVGRRYPETLNQVPHSIREFFEEVPA